MSKQSEELLKKAYCGIDATRRNGKLKIRVRPYVEIKSPDDKELTTLKDVLLCLSIGSTVRLKSTKQHYSFLRIHGIQNCNLILPYIQPPGWWKIALDMFLNKEHCQRDGIQKILSLRPNVKPNRLSDQEIVDTLMDLE